MTVTPGSHAPEVAQKHSTMHSHDAKDGQNVHNAWRKTNPIQRVLLISRDKQAKGAAMSNPTSKMLVKDFVEALLKCDAIFFFSKDELPEQKSCCAHLSL